MWRTLFCCLCAAGMFLPSARAQEDPNESERQFRFLLSRGNELRAEYDKLNAKTAPDGVTRWKTDAHRLEGDYRRFLSAHPKHARAMVAFGDWLFDAYGEEQSEEEVRWWKQAMVVDPREAYAYNSLANFYGHNGKAAEALRMYAKAIELAPTEPIFRFNWATTCQLFRNESRAVYGWNKDEIFDHALEQFKSARDLAPQDYELATSYASTFYQMPKPNWAQAYDAWKFCLNQQLNEQQRNFVCTHLARVCVNLGRYDEAREWLTKLSPGEQESSRRAIERKIAELTHPHGGAASATKAPGATAPGAAHP